MLQQFLRHINDQFDYGREKATKLAETLSSRKEQLKEASYDDFAVVLHDGREKHPKFPVQTETDIKMSKEALERSREEMPNEVIETAEYFIDQHAREKTAEAAFEDRPDSKPTNIVYVGSIDKKAWEAKREEVSVPSETVMIDGMEYPLDKKEHVKAAEKMIDSKPLSPQERCPKAQKVIQQAEKTGASLTKESVQRFDRSSLPVRFEEHIGARKKRAPDELKPMYNELQKQATSKSLTEVAEKLQSLDQVAGLAPMEGEKMASRIQPTAHQVVFPTEEKSKTDEDLSKVASLFGEEFADTYRQEGETALEALSSAEKDLFRDALQGAQ